MRELLSAVHGRPWRWVPPWPFGMYGLTPDGLGLEGKTDGGFESRILICMREQRTSSSRNISRLQSREGERCGSGLNGGFGGDIRTRAFRDINATGKNPVAPKRRFSRGRGLLLLLEIGNWAQMTCSSHIPNKRKTCSSARARAHTKQLKKKKPNSASNVIRIQAASFLCIIYNKKNDRSIP